MRRPMLVIVTVLVALVSLSALPTRQRQLQPTVVASAEKPNDSLGLLAELGLFVDSAPSKNPMGLKQGDFISSIGGRSVDSVTQVKVLLVGGKRISVGFFRYDPVAGRWRPLTARTRSKSLGVMVRMGAMVTHVYPGATVDLKVQDIVFRVNGREFDSSTKFQNALSFSVVNKKRTLTTVRVGPKGGTKQVLATGSLDGPPTAQLRPPKDYEICCDGCCCSPTLGLYCTYNPPWQTDVYACGKAAPGVGCGVRGGDIAGCCTVYAI